MTGRRRKKKIRNRVARIKSKIFDTRSIVDELTS
jgi:hypothetical protein